MSSYTAEESASVFRCSVAPTVVLDCTMEEVYALMASDLTAIDKVNPAVREAQCVSEDGESVSGVGAARKCTMYDGSSVIETVTKIEDKDPDFRAQHFVCSEFGMPVSEMTIKQTFKRIDASEATGGKERCEFMLRVDFTMKFGPVGWLLAQAMVKRALYDVCEKVILGSEYHLKTGKLIGKDADWKSIKALHASY